MAATTSIGLRAALRTSTRHWILDSSAVSRTPTVFQTTRSARFSTIAATWPLMVDYEEVIRSSRNRTDAAIGSSSSIRSFERRFSTTSSTPPPSPQAKNNNSNNKLPHLNDVLNQGQSRSKFMQYVHKYGAAFVLTEVVISTICTAGLYFAIRQGVDVESLLSSLQDWWQGPHVHDDSEREITQWTATGGTFALAFAANKLLMPLRTPIAIALTPKVAKFLRLHSFQFPPASSSSNESSSSTASTATKQEQQQ